MTMVSSSPSCHIRLRRCGGDRGLHRCRCRCLGAPITAHVVIALVALVFFVAVFVVLVAVVFEGDVVVVALLVIVVAAEYAP